MNKLPAFNPLGAAVFLARAKASAQRQQFERALADLAEALRLNPLLGEALMVRATVCVAMGDYRQALADVATILEVGFETAKTRVRYAMSKLRACMGAYL